MRTKRIILLSVSACFLGVAFYFFSKYTIDRQLGVFENKLRATFIEALDQELNSRKIKGSLKSTIPISESMLAAELPDSVCIVDSLGEHWYRFDPLKHKMNVTPIIQMRYLHSYAFSRTPLIPDSLNSIWSKNLFKSNISARSALQISIINEKGHVRTHCTTQSEWCKNLNPVFLSYIGYANEIEVFGYLDYSLWDKILLPILLYILLYIACVYAIYIVGRIKHEKIVIMPQKEIVEVPVLKMVKVVNDTPIRSYVLHENIVFDAELQKIEKNGSEIILQNQANFLLELFLLNRENDYILTDNDIKEKLWPDENVNVERIHKAIARLRLKIREVDSSIDIKRGTGTYQLLL